MAAPYHPAAGPSRPHLQVGTSFHTPSSAMSSATATRTDRFPLAHPQQWPATNQQQQQHPQPTRGYPLVDPGMPSSRTASRAASRAASRTASPVPPPSPHTPHPGDSPAAAGIDNSAAKRNPFIDLIETEKVYVDQLTLVIRRVAAAWSRRNLPPPKLDAMFRCIEAVYRANRAFGVRLKEIGANPSNPKALGDLLMRWVDDLEPSYARYATIFLTGFDSYPAVCSNEQLHTILDEICISAPPTPPLERWSLDALFILPYTRLRYYRKLYSRLLQNTTEGRSDHRLLATAAQRLDMLVNQVESRLETDVSEEDTPVPSSAGAVSREQSWPNEKGRTSQTSSGRDSSIESQSVLSSFNSRLDSTRNSVTSAGTSITHSPGAPPKVFVPNVTSPPVSDLELRIDTERAIDLFTMQPRKCKLHINPPALPYTRSLRSAHDVKVYFTPTSTGKQVVHSRAHIFILSDLFLVADRMEAMEKATKAQQVAREQPNRVGEGGPMPEMWLAYPPLAGKHLSVVEGQQSNVVAVTVMRRETFVIHAESEMERDQIMKSLTDCISFASGNVSQRVTPLPSPIERSPVDGSPMSNDAAHYPSPMSPVGQLPTPNGLAAPFGKLALEPGQALQWPGQPQPQQQRPQTPSSNSGHGASGAGFPPRGASLRGRGQPPSPMLPLGAQHGIPAASMSDPSLSNSNLPRNTSTRSAQSSHSEHSNVPGNNFMAAPPHHYNQHPPRQQPQPMQVMPGQPMPVQHLQQPQPGHYQRQGVTRLDLPPVPQSHAGSHMSDGGHMQYPDQRPSPLDPPRARSAEPFRDVDVLRPPDKPSERFGAMRAESPAPGQQRPRYDDDDDLSPPPSPVQEEPTTINGPTVISAQMKCKVFLQQGHGQWKSLGQAKLKLYVEKARNVKQLVVDSESRSKSVLISTIVLMDGVERVGKTGVAVEISDRGQRTGIIYMIQLRNEVSAGGLHESLLAGSARDARR